MASYLHNVAARVLQQSVSIQPRLPSLFEPPAASLSARLAPFTNLRPGADVQQGHDGTVPAPSTIGPQPEDRVSATLPTPHDDSHRQPAIVQDPPPLRRAAETRTVWDKTAPRIPHSESEDSVPAENPPPRPRPRIAPANFISDEISRVVPLAKEARAKAPVDGSLSDVSTRESRPHADAIAPRTSEPSALEFDDRPPKASQQPAFLPLKQPPATATPAVTAPSVSHAVEAGPNITVVIGRVSVQAVMPQSSAVRPPSPPPAPLLSLEKYLKQRGGSP